MGIIACFPCWAKIGSLGEVFYAEDTSQDPPQPVAVKILHPHLLADTQALGELRREAEVLARLKHPNIIGLVELKIEPHQAYLVTEYAAEGSLAALLRPDPDQPPIPLTLKEVVDCLKQIAEALHHVHNFNFVHCELKPENILLDHAGNVKLADFSLATQVSGWSSIDLLKSNEAWGTPYYAAPEQWDGKIGKVSDIYALGVVIYQLLTGFTPYQGNAQELKEQHRNVPIPLLKDLAPDLRYPPGLNAEALAKKSFKRISSANQLYTRLVAALDESTGSSSTPGKGNTVTALSSPQITVSNNASSISNAGSQPLPASLKNRKNSPSLDKPLKLV